MSKASIYLNTWLTQFQQRYMSCDEVNYQYTCNAAYDFAFKQIKFSSNQINEKTTLLTTFPCSANHSHGKTDHVTTVALLANQINGVTGQVTIAPYCPFLERADR